MRCCLQCFDTVGWAWGRGLSCKELSGMFLAWLSVQSKVQMIYSLITCLSFATETQTLLQCCCCNGCTVKDCFNRVASF